MKAMMDVDWREVVDLELRGIQRADLSFRFSHFATDALAGMVRRALARDDRERQRVVVGATRLGRVDSDQIVKLASLPNFPRG